MKAELTISPDFADELAQMILERIKPMIGSSPSQVIDTLFDVKGLSDYLAVGPDWIYKHVHLKEIPHLKVKGLLRFRKSQIDKWINSYGVPVVEAVRKPMKVVRK